MTASNASARLLEPVVGAVGGRTGIALPCDLVVMALQKLVADQACDNVGLATTQILATFFDGAARQTPELVRFKRLVEEVGSQQTVRERGCGRAVTGDEDA